MNWQTKNDRLTLHKNLVSIPSISRSEEEKKVPEFLYNETMKLDYFKKNSNHVKKCYFNDNSSYFSALVKKPNTKKTVILISHFDVVGVDDFGEQKEHAFSIDKMTEFYKSNGHLLASHIQEEIKEGNWVFGRGSMDMKAGLVVEMGIMEKASLGHFDGNLLLITVSDEEVSSNGMLHAVEEIKKLKEEHELEYLFCLNTEPSFKEHPYDQNKYLYTGTIGKLMPSFYLKGQETHVGEPFAGLNASYMCSVLTEALELCSDFQEEVEGEKTQVLTNLMMRDLKPFYNVQTPVAAVSMFNLLYMEQSLEEITNRLLIKTKDISHMIIKRYHERAKKAGVKGLDFQIHVVTWQEAYKKAIGHVGENKLTEIINQTNERYQHLDEREKTLKIVESVTALIPGKNPMIVFYYSPPFYPAVSSRNNDLIKNLSEYIMKMTREKFDIDLEKRCFFQGLCDLSYVSINDPNVGALTDNMPLFNKGYNIPFDTISQFDFPVMNLGPYGSDPHQKTERLELDFSFETLPEIIESLLNKAFS
jgi:arginine utilization protein RocB